MRADVSPLKREDSQGGPTAGLQAEGFTRLMVCRARFVSQNALARAMRGFTGASKTQLHAEIRLEGEWRGPATMLSNR